MRENGIVIEVMSISGLFVCFFAHFTVVDGQFRHFFVQFLPIEMFQIKKSTLMGTSMRIAVDGAVITTADVVRLSNQRYRQSRSLIKLF